MQDNDLISKAAAIDALTDTNLKRNIDSVCDGDMNRTRRAAQRVIAQLPTVDAAPVVHGRWLRERDEDDNEHIVCSNCGAKYDSDIVFAYHDGKSPRLELEGLEYCPHCGALMDGGEDGADGT